MSYKTILACLTTTEAGAQIMPAACALARRFDAHLIGIHTLGALVPYPGIAMHSDDPYFDTFNQSMQVQNEEVKAVFERHTAAETFVSEWRSVPAKATRASPQLVRSAFRSDLVVVAQSDRESDRPDQRTIRTDLILQSGRPVLVIPPNQQDKPFGSKPLLAWNATREATVAARASLPLLKGADEVTVLTVSASRDSEPDLSTEGHELAANLARHGVQTHVRHVALSRPTVGEQILYEAEATSSDMLVMGAFGHSRLHGLIFGNATDHVLAQADLPVMFSG